MSKVRQVHHILMTFTRCRRVPPTGHLAEPRGPKFPMSSRRPRG